MIETKVETKKWHKKSLIYKNMRVDTFISKFVINKINKQMSLTKTIIKTKT